MLYYASKAGWFLVTPSNLLLLLILVGSILATKPRLRRAGTRLSLAGAALALAAGLSPLANGVIAPLENRFPAYRDDGRPVDGIIVLGGVLDEETSAARGQLAVNEAAERVIALGDLARRHPEARLVFSGGSGALIAARLPEADALLAFAATLGVARERVSVENRSRTTRENAALTRALVMPQEGERWLLVTSAWHMPRAVGCFRRVGFPVIAYPVDYRTGGERMRGFAFAADGLRRLDLAAKEWIGLLAYTAAGYTSELWPGPEPAP